jgi:hypothetical protein
MENKERYKGTDCGIVFQREKEVNDFVVPNETAS